MRGAKSDTKTYCIAFFSVLFFFDPEGQKGRDGATTGRKKKKPTTEAGNPEGQSVKASGTAKWRSEAMTNIDGAD